MGLRWILVVVLHVVFSYIQWGQLNKNMFLSSCFYCIAFTDCHLISTINIWFIFNWKSSRKHGNTLKQSATIYLSDRSKLMKWGKEVEVDAPSTCSSEFDSAWLNVSVHSHTDQSVTLSPTGSKELILTCQNGPLMCIYTHTKSCL